MSTLVIIDIDGVVKPFTSSRILAQNPSNITYEGAAPSGAYYNFCIDPEKWINFLNDINLAADEEVKFIWGSMWKGDSNVILKELGLEETWEYIDISTSNVGLGTWKLKSILPYLQDPQYDLVVWIEDELEADVFKLAEERGRMLPVKTEKYEGLTSVQMREIVDFIKSSK